MLQDMRLKLILSAILFVAFLALILVCVLPDGGSGRGGTCCGSGAKIYATWSNEHNPTVPVRGPLLYLSNNDLTVTKPSFDQSEGPPYANILSTIFKTTGKHYWEVSCINNNPVPTQEVGAVGISNPANLMPFQGNTLKLGAGNDGISFGWGGQNSYEANPDVSGNSLYITNGTPGVNSYVATGNVYMFAIDLDNSKFWFGQNGTWYNNGTGVGNPSAATNPTATIIAPNIRLYAALSFSNDVLNSYSPSFTANFGATPFSFPVPKNFNAGLYNIA